ncbi:ankyrin repeat domain-containing protein [Fimbriimonas ginsengisoli]|uniref:Ankyrin n=1 Tax=Fimbriimonas ginsengisoli Gsoil 348 TaxID=661478 RepID=A0A068NLM9_FIMGI|nr:ankyrin repeat domain-containing protein [Fimbriimonas ginsengisoli]AIE83660.1 Ankyrin [Fimbriimonas ginsengisoli Gsoil 348]
MAWRVAFGGAELDGAAARLVDAAHRGDAEGVRTAVQEGANPNLTFADDEGYFNLTPLMIAAQGGHVEAIRVLLKAKAKVKAKNKHISPEDGGGETALDYAVAGKHQEAARLLLEHGANLDAIESGNTPLMLAVMRDDEELVRFLLDLGADPNVASKVCSALYMAVDRDQPAIARLLLERGADPNWGDAHFHATSLIKACKKGQLECVRALLQGGADPNRQDDLHRFPLYEAATGGVIYQLKTDEDWKRYGNALNLAGSCLLTDENAKEIVELLLEYGADVHRRSPRWGTALEGAEKADRGEIYRLLVAAGA